MLIWETSSKQRTELKLDTPLDNILEICFSIYYNVPALVLSCNLGLQICSVNNQFKQFTVAGSREDFTLLSTSTCGKFIAVACRIYNPSKSSTIKVFDIENEEKLIFCMKFALEVKSILLTSNSEIIVILFEKMLRFYLIRKEILVYEMPVHTDYCSKITNITQDENAFCIIGIGSIHLYDIDWNH